MPERQRVSGIGGFFFRAADPAALGRWYDEQLGVLPPPESYDESSWWQQAGPTVLAPMAAGAEHVSGAGWTLNLRVDDLDAMVAQLRGAGVEVLVDDEDYPNGRFADLRDPEGNGIQLWQPAGADARGPR
jgi:catechol 2,3-dioxygenase-like lactoylglutathione lyase family enzyme